MAKIRHNMRFLPACDAIPRAVLNIKCAVYLNPDGRRRALPLPAADPGRRRRPNAQRRRKRNIFAWRRWLVTGPI